MNLESSNTFLVSVKTNSPTPVFARIKTVIQKFSVLISTGRENRHGRKFWLRILEEFHISVHQMEDTTVVSLFLPSTA